MLHFLPTFVFKPLIPRRPIPYLHPLLPCSWLSFFACCLLSPQTLSRFSNGMLEVFEPGALNYFTFFRPILSTLSVSTNPILTPLPLSKFLDSLRYVLIAPTTSLAFSLQMPRTLAAVSSLSSGRVYFL